MLSAYRDNAAVIAGSSARRYFPDPATGIYRAVSKPVDILMKVETHNHPTAISPFPGASTGSGGEIRDEGATGRGAKPKAGLVGFSVSNLRIPDFEQPWEQDHGKPARIASALDIMLDGPLGAAAFNNEFGRPCIARLLPHLRACPRRRGHAHPRLPQADHDRGRHGQHPPRARREGRLSGRREGRRARRARDADRSGRWRGFVGRQRYVVGADLDFASVQRGNPEMQRRAQEVIDRCWALGDRNPIHLIHDVGAGGLSNAVPEAVAHSDRGARIELRAVPNEEPGMSPMEIWCNEAQERYVLIVSETGLDRFEAIARRERCPYAVIGSLTDDGRLAVDRPDVRQPTGRHAARCAARKGAAKCAAMCSASAASAARCRAGR